MRNNLRFIKDMRLNTSPSILETLKSFILGDKDISFHNENKVYNKGDVIISPNKETGKLQVLECIKDGVVGEFNPIDWVSSSVIDNTNRNKLDNLIVVDSELPSGDETKLWFKVEGIRDYHPGYDLIPADHYSTNILNGTIPIEGVGELPEEDVKLFFTALSEEDGLDHYIYPGEKPVGVLLDEQSDIHIDNNTPPSESIMWIKKNE